MAGQQFLGIIVTPANAQSEGLEPVMDNVCRAGATAIALDPWLLQPVSPDMGARMPDLHIDGYERLLGRPLWGKRELYVASYLAFAPDRARYEGTRYAPPSAPIPPELDRDLPHKMIHAARARGLEAHMGLAPFFPPGVRDEDLPVRIDGRPVQPPLIANTACLNNPGARAYALAFIEDTLAHYPEIDGLILDWAEFGAYRLQDHFTCVCAHCARQAEALGYNWREIMRDVRALWDELHDLTPTKLERAQRLLRNPSEMLALLAAYPGWLAFLRFKAACVTGFYRQVRDRLPQQQGDGVVLSARGWIAPWNLSSGMDYQQLASICDAVLPKLFTFDHAVLPRWIGQTLLQWNPTLSESALLDTITAWLNLPDDIEHRSFANYHIPAPDEPHPARLSSYRVRLDETVAQVAGRARCYPIAHPYLPDAQWKRMVALVRDSAVDGMWVNFYSYLTDDRLEALRQVWQARLPVGAREQREG